MMVINAMDVILRIIIWKTANVNRIHKKGIKHSLKTV